MNGKRRLPALLILLGLLPIILPPAVQPVRPGTVRTDGIAPAAPALSGFRGLAAALIWLEASVAAGRGDFPALGRCYDLLSRLQPRQEEAWLFRGWNLAVNAAGAHPEGAAADAWFWRGLDHLRLDGMASLPDSWRLALRISDLLAEGLAGEGGRSRRLRLRKEMAAALGGSFSPAGQAAALAGLAADPAGGGLARFRRTTGLEPRRLLELNRRFGLFDWREGSAQAFHWAWLAAELRPGHDQLSLFASLAAAMLRAADGTERDGKAGSGRAAAFAAWLVSGDGYGEVPAGGGNPRLAEALENLLERLSRMN